MSVFWQVYVIAVGYALVLAAGFAYADFEKRRGGGPITWTGSKIDHGAGWVIARMTRRRSRT